MQAPVVGLHVHRRAAGRDVRELHVHDVVVEERRVGDELRHGVFRRIVDVHGVVRAGHRALSEVDEILAADGVAGEVADARNAVDRLRREERERMRGLEGGGVVGEDLVAASARILVHVEARAGGIEVEPVEARAVEAADGEGVLAGLPAERRDVEGRVGRAGPLAAAGDRDAEPCGNRAALPAAVAGAGAEEVAREGGRQGDAVRRAGKRLEFRDGEELRRERGVRRVPVDQQIGAVLAQVEVVGVGAGKARGNGRHDRRFVEPGRAGGRDHSEEDDGGQTPQLLADTGYGMEFHCVSPVVVLLVAAAREPALCRCFGGSSRGGDRRCGSPS